MLIANDPAEPKKKDVMLVGGFAPGQGYSRFWWFASREILVCSCSIIESLQIKASILYAKPILDERGVDKINLTLSGGLCPDFRDGSPGAKTRAALN